MRVPAAPPAEPPPSAEDFARRAQRGCRESYDQLVARFQGPLYQFLLIRTGRPRDAEELAHDTLVRAWERIALYDSAWRFSTWLYTIARRETASFYRRAARGPALGGPPELISPAAEPADALSAAEGRAELWELAARVLPPVQLSALWLRYAEDMTPTEIARSLGRQPSAMRVLLHRARRSLAKHLMANGKPLHRRPHPVVCKPTWPLRKEA
jgi:RNA polymerase sigma-70 factor (ECF subfamily)